jgi:[ribosomal protein S5]-alanine N-acetyltransferase
MLHIQFDPFPELITGRLRLRRMVANDAERLFQLRSDPRVMQHIDRPLMHSLDDAYPFIAKNDEYIENEEGINWAICLKEDNLYIGNICLWHLSKENYQAELGYSLMPHYWHRGIMSEAMQAVLRYGFETMKANRMEADTNPLNIDSCKTLELNGFKREAYFKEKYYWLGEFRDTVIYALLRSQWEQNSIID